MCNQKAPQKSTLVSSVQSVQEEQASVSSWHWHADQSARHIEDKILQELEPLLPSAPESQLATARALQLTCHLRFGWPPHQPTSQLAYPAQSAGPQMLVGSHTLVSICRMIHSNPSSWQQLKTLCQRLVHTAQHISMAHLCYLQLPGTAQPDRLSCTRNHAATNTEAL